MSSRTDSSVEADSQIVPDDHACSFDLVYAKGGSSHTSCWSPTASTAADDTRSAITRSVLKGRCGPCCSMAPSGCTMMLDEDSESATCGARSSANRRDTDATHARYAADIDLRETRAVSVIW